MILASLAAGILSWLLQFVIWFLLWTPVVALVEYATHRWIMHMANRLLDPTLRQFQTHQSHHEGSNEADLVDMPWKNALLLAAPFFLGLIAWGLLVGPLASIVIPGAAFLLWTLVYTYLWTRIHRAIHDVENNWFRRMHIIFRFFRDHHLRHHIHPTTNYATVFPWTDYLFFTWHRPRSRGRAPTANIA